MKLLIVGVGTLGYKLAHALSVTNHDVTVADNNVKTLEQAQKCLNLKTVKINCIESAALQALHIADYDMAIVTTHDDETNIICGSMLKKLGCHRVIACIYDPEFVRQQIFIQDVMDIDYMINPDMITSNEMAGFLLKDFPFYSTQLGEGRLMLMETTGGIMARWLDKPIKDIKCPPEAIIVALKRDGVTTIPTGDTKIEKDDTLYILGNSYHLKDFMREAQAERVDRAIHRIMIIGGGKMGYYLASNLSNKGVGIKVIERDAARCEYLSENLSDNALVINGDGADINLLLDEEFEQMDAFLGVTGHDEENLLMTLMAKKMGVGRVAARVSQSNYVSIIEQLGVDAAFSAIDITVREILKYIRGKTVLACSRLLGKEIEISEVLIDKTMPIINCPINRLNVPEGILLGALLKRDSVGIPRASTVIEPGDKLVTFSHNTIRPTLERFLYGIPRN